MITTNLFNVFDPSTSNIFNNNWIALYIPLILFPYTYWALFSLSQTPYFLISKYISKELKNNLSKINFKTISIFLTLFWIILWNNIIGLFPYIFTSTSHLITTITIALPFWILFIIYGWFNITNHIFSHLVPLGTPNILSFFIVFIETTSNFIRPLTLSVRLTANIIAGHLLLRLLRGLSENIPSLFLPSTIILITLLTLEYAVALIQSYVFITLLSLYLNEIN